MKKTVNACLVCSAPLIYTPEAVEMTCEGCGKHALSNAACENGHFICDACHGSAGRISIRWHCLQSQEKNPIALAQTLMELPGIHMHGPEHHMLVGAALLTAYHNCGGALDLGRAMREMERRGGAVPGGICGFWGCCGAAVSAGIFTSIVTQASPLAREPWGLSNLMTSACLKRIGEVGGPRCCKRNTFLAIETAAAFAADKLGVSMSVPARVACTRFEQNTECLGSTCPFHPQSV